MLLLCRRAGEFGVRVAEATLDLQAAQDRKERVVRKNLMGTEALLKKHRVATIQGTGTLAGPDRIHVAGSSENGEVEAGAVIIATGSVVGSLPMAPVDHRVILSSDDVLGLDRVPESLLVIGAGAVGVEFASIYHVRVEGDLDRARAEAPAARGRRDLRGAPALVPEAGMEVHAGAELAQVRVEAAGAWSEFRIGETAKRIRTERVLMAAGRRPATEGIGLEASGVAMDRGYVPVDCMQRTNVPGVYAIGDVTKSAALAHVASHEGIVAVEAIAGKRPHPVNHSAIPSCTYSHPQVASVGMTEAQARASGRQVRVGKFPFTASSRTSILGEGDGFVKAISDAATGEILGVHHRRAGHGADRRVGGGAALRSDRGGAGERGARASDAGRGDHGGDVWNRRTGHSCLRPGRDRSRPCAAPLRPRCI